jgi:hypothetical protein
MGVRGRKSGASLSVSVTNLPGQRPEPPKELTAEQADEWRAVVARMPADWFTRETYPLLVQFCRHVCRSREVEAVLAGFDMRSDVEGFDRLTKIAEREGRAVSSLATRMRLTQHSRYSDKGAHGAAARAGADAPSGKLWERKTA